MAGAPRPTDLQERGQEALGLVVAGGGLVGAVALFAIGLDRSLECGFFGATCSVEEQQRADSAAVLMLGALVVAFTATLAAQWVARRRLEWGRMFLAWGAAFASLHAWLAVAGPGLGDGVAWIVALVVFAAVLVPTDRVRGRVLGGVAALGVAAVSGDRPLVAVLGAIVVLAASALLPGTTAPTG